MTGATSSSSSRSSSVSAMSSASSLAVPKNWVSKSVGLSTCSTTSGIWTPCNRCWTFCVEALSMPSSNPWNSPWFESVSKSDQFVRPLCLDGPSSVTVSEFDAADSGCVVDSSGSLADVVALFRVIRSVGSAGFWTLFGGIYSRPDSCSRLEFGLKMTLNDVDLIQTGSCGSARGSSATAVALGAPLLCPFLGLHKSMAIGTKQCCQ